ncbi:hypothetical protein QL285_085837 [Trifolium repens]|nr:hypothetical protein QL285_085837 [Trifolium repens]
MEDIGEERGIVEGNKQAHPTSLKQHLIHTLEMQSKLTRPFDEIRNIKVGREVWKLRVRIVNLWYAKDYLKHKHIEMVLMDSNCDRIQILVPPRYVRSFSSKLVQYQTIILNNFKVKENDLLSRACPNPLMLVWFDDIVGVVHEVTFHQRDDSKLPLVMFVLRDINQVLLDCLLWGSHATTFLAGVRHDVGVEPTTVILRNVVNHEAYEYSPISIGNGDYGTQIFTDQSIAETIDFKQSMPDTYRSIITIRIGNIDSPILVGNDQDNLGLDGEICRLQQLNELIEEFECITIGTTQQIIVSHDGWTYEGCGWCSKNVFVSEGVLKCGNGHVNSIVTPRYKLEIEVIHHGEKSVFVFSDSLCAHFFGIFAFELKKSLLVDEQCHARFYPLILDDILGLKMVAKVKWNPTFKNNYVHSYSTEQTLVELVESKIFIKI